MKRHFFRPPPHMGTGIWLTSIICWSVATAICVYLIVTQGGLA